MAKRSFGPREVWVNIAINSLRTLTPTQVDQIAKLATPSRLAARSRALSVAKANGRSAYWSAARFYAGSEVNTAASLSAHMHYTKIKAGNPWHVAREAARDAAAAVTILDLLDPATAVELTRPIVDGYPALRPHFLGHR